MLYRILFSTPFYSDTKFFDSVTAGRHVVCRSPRSGRGKLGATVAFQENFHAREHGKRKPFTEELAHAKITP